MRSLLTLLVFASVAAAQGLAPAVESRIDAIVQDLVRKDHTPGAVVLVGRGDETLLRRAWGHRRRAPRAEPMTPDTLFDLASLTKSTCTALAVMLLVDRGRVDAEDPVTRHVPAFRGRKKDAIRVRHLLTHTSGLPAYTSVNHLRREHGAGPRPDAVLDRIAGLSLKYPTGEGYVYSCLNYLTLAHLVQAVTGAPQDVLLKKHVWGPLRMTDTTFRPTAGQRRRTAPTTRQRRGAVHDPLAAYSVCPEHAPGNAGAFSTVDDMAKLLRVVMAGGLHGTRRILSEASCQAMLTDGTGGVANRSFGWAVKPAPDVARPRVTHTGYTGTMIWMDPATSTYLIFFTNCVYPHDDKADKRAVIAARKAMIRAVDQGLRKR